MRRAVTSRAPSRRSAWSIAALVVTLTLAGCGSDAGTGNDTAGNGSSAAGDGASTGRAVTIEGQEALVWGDGEYGVVLAHGAAFDAASWADQAPAMAETGATVVAVEDISPDGIAAAVDWLQAEGHPEVALVGGSAGADGILDLASRERGVADQLVLLSPNGTVDGLGEEPKLVVASEDEPGADVATELAESAPGDDNEVVLLPGAAHAQHLFDTEQAEPALDLVLERIRRFGVED